MLRIFYGFHASVNAFRFVNELRFARVALLFML